MRARTPVPSPETPIHPACNVQFLKALGQMYRILTMLAAASMVLVGCGGDSDNPAATKALTDATRKMQQAPSYSFDATITVGQTKTNVKGEFQAPDRLHQVVTAPGAAIVEIISVGSQVFVKDPTTGMWHNQPGSAQQGSIDPRAAFEALAKATNIDEEYGLYEFELTGEAARIAPGASGKKGEKAKGTAKLAGKRVSMLELRAPGNNPIVMRISYANFGSATPVEPPVVAP